MIDSKQKARLLIQQHLDPRHAQIVDLTLITGGATNTTYRLKNSLGEFYQVRVGNAKIDRNNEQRLLKATGGGGFIFYDAKNGDGIRTWINGKEPTKVICHSSAFISSFSHELHKLQANKIDPEITKRDFYIFEKISDLNNFAEETQKYHEIIEKYKNLPLVLAHNDLRPANLIWNNKNVFFIDYEWGSLNSKYWDLANFLREIEYPVIKLQKIIDQYFPDFSLSILHEFLFATTFFAYTWTFFPPPEADLGVYRKNCVKLFKEYFSILKLK